MFTEEKANLYSATTEQKLVKEESVRIHSKLTKEISEQKLLIDELNAKIADLDAANQLLTRTHTAIQRELEIASRNQTQTSQFCVELRMQGLDFKAEVDRRAEKIIASVQSRLGFVPSCIQKDVTQLRVLKVRFILFILIQLVCSNQCIVTLCLAAAPG